jgi:hypothetical protein
VKWIHNEGLIKGEDVHLKRSKRRSGSSISTGERDGPRLRLKF